MPQGKGYKLTDEEKKKRQERIDSAGRKAGLAGGAMGAAAGMLLGRTAMSTAIGAAGGYVIGRHVSRGAASSKAAEAINSRKKRLKELEGQL